jgi:hypothetical protein
MINLGVIIFTVIVVLVLGYTGTNFSPLNLDLTSKAKTTISHNGLVQYAFGDMYGNNPDPRTVLDNLTESELVHYNSPLKIKQHLDKAEYKSGEKILIQSVLINTGNKTLEIHYSEATPFETYFINHANHDMTPKIGSWPIIPDGFYNITIKPGSQFPLDYNKDSQSLYQSFVLVPGNYTVITGANIAVYDNMTEIDYGYLWSEPLQIKVLSENYLEDVLVLLGIGIVITGVILVSYRKIKHKKIIN